jgi:hypothetical protein
MGAAMGRLKKFVANNRPRASRNKIRPWFVPLEQVDWVDSSMIAPDRLRIATLAFVQDFLLEHSPYGLNIASIEISSSF